MGEKSNDNAPDTCEQSYGYAPDVGEKQPGVREKENGVCQNMPLINTYLLI